MKIGVANALFATYLLSGCASRSPFTSAEMLRLADPPAAPSIVASEWISARKGVEWTLGTASGSRLVIRCVESTTTRAMTLHRFTMERDGKPWREEVLGVGRTGLWLVSMAKAGGPRMRLDPPMPLSTGVPSPGAEIDWVGNIRIGSESMAAQGYSAVFDESHWANSNSGKPVVGLDTVLELLPARGEAIPFPVTRWYEAGTGLVHLRLGVDGEVRDYAKTEHPAESRP